MDDQKQKKVILIVEDDASYLIPLSKELQVRGYEILQAMNGTEGVKVALDNHPDLIVLDILMPAMDGMTTMNNLRRDIWGKTVPIIMLTNLNPDDKILKGVVQDEPAYYLIKSEISLDTIVEKIESLLKTS